MKRDPSRTRLKYTLTINRFPYLPQPDPKNQSDTTIAIAATCSSVSRCTIKPLTDSYQWHIHTWWDNQVQCRLALLPTGIPPQGQCLIVSNTLTYISNPPITIQHFKQWQCHPVLFHCQGQLLILSTIAKHKIQVDAIPAPLGCCLRYCCITRFTSRQGDDKTERMRKWLFVNIK